MDDSQKSRDQLVAELRQLRGQSAERQARAGVDRSLPVPAESAELLRTIIANVPIVLFAVDRDGIITLSEGKGLERLGGKPGASVGRAVVDLYPDIPGIEQKLSRALRGESASARVEMGDAVVEAWYTPLRNPEGDIVGVGALAVDVTQREQAQASLRAERRLMERMLQSHERDRQLMAYEIHDGLVQDITGAQLQLDALLEGDQLPPGVARDQTQRAADLMHRAVSEARRLVSGLRPPVLDERGVVPAIEHLLEGRRAEGPTITLTARVQSDRLEPLLEATIYRIVQEAITNVKRHSQSDRADIRLTQVDDRIHIEVQDWGIGFDPTGVNKNRFGLQGIRERARLLRGRAVIDSAPGNGTRIVVDLPVVPALEEVQSATSWSIE